MDSWHNDKAKVKDVFDAIRNYGICGLIFYAGTYQLVESAGSKIEILYICSGVGLVLVSVYLYYINTKIFNRLFHEWAPDGMLRSALHFIFPSLVTGLVGIYLLTHSAFVLNQKSSVQGATNSKSEASAARPELKR